MILSDVCKLHMYSAISKFVFAIPREWKYTVQDQCYCYEIKEIKTELREVDAEVKANSRQNHRIHRCEDQTCCWILQQRETYRLWNVAQTRSGLMEVDMKIRLCCLADVIKMDPQWIKFAVKLLCNAECSNTKEYWFLWEAMQNFTRADRQKLLIQQKSQR